MSLKPKFSPILYFSRSTWSLEISCVYISMILICITVLNYNLSMRLDYGYSLLKEHNFGCVVISTNKFQLLCEHIVSFAD